MKCIWLCSLYTQLLFSLTDFGISIGAASRYMTNCAVHVDILYDQLSCIHDHPLLTRHLPCTEEEEEALLFFFITSNYCSPTTLFRPSRSPFLNFTASHGVGVAQAKPACKHTIATRKCYQYNTIQYMIYIKCRKEKGYFHIALYPVRWTWLYINI